MLLIVNALICVYTVYNFTKTKLLLGTHFKICIYVQIDAESFMPLWSNKAILASLLSFEMIKYLLLAHNALVVPYFNNFYYIIFLISAISIIAGVMEFFITNMY